jgi:solute carrier family 25 (mitochondrial carnitine/acylcarnitine transporter), member 20/29
METFNRLVRGVNSQEPKPLLVGLARLYRGLGVSALRSVLTHGVLWMLFDWIGAYIDELPRHGIDVDGERERTSVI